PSPKPVITSRSDDLVAADATANPGWQTSFRVRMPTELVGLQWDGAHSGAVELRILRGDRWSAWSQVEGDPAEGPDDDSREHHAHTSAGPVWVGHGVQAVDVRVVEGSLRHLRINSVRSENPARSALSLPPAAAEPGQPGIITRAQWGADESWRSHNPGCT